MRISRQQLEDFLTGTDSKDIGLSAMTDYGPETLMVPRQWLVKVVKNSKAPKRWKFTDRCYECKGLRDWPGIVAGRNEYETETCSHPMHRKNK